MRSFGLDGRRGRRRALGEIGVDRRQAALVELGEEPLAHARRRRRAQLEVGEGGLQVEAGAADDDRPPAGVEGGVDLPVSARGELRPRSLRDGHEGDEPVLEPLLLLGVAAPVRISRPR